jgi:hypothetical protein
MVMRTFRHDPEAEGTVLFCGISPISDYHPGLHFIETMLRGDQKQGSIAGGEVRISYAIAIFSFID